MSSDWTKTCIKTSNGWQRFEDYCNRQPKGTPFLYTTGILNIDDVVRDIELGEKAANMWLLLDRWSRSSVTGIERF